MRTIGNYKDELAAILSGLDISTVDGVYVAIERAARIVAQNADIPEAMSIQNVTLYSGVTDYACDSRIFGTAIKDIRPIGVSRNYSDFVYKRPSEMFDRTKGYRYNGTTATFEYDNGSPIIRMVSSRTLQQVNIDQMSDTTGWVNAGTVGTLVKDTATFYHSPASIRFNISGAGLGTLTKSIQSLNISQYEGVGVAFLALQLPTGTPTNLTSVKLRLTSSNAGYSEVTSTSQFLGTFFTGNFMLIPFDFSTATSVGSPDWSKIVTAEIDITTASSFANVRTGGLWMSMPNQMQIVCQTAAFFKTPGGQMKTTITDDNDEIILNDAAYTIFTYEGAKTITQQMGATVTSDTMVTFDTILGNIPGKPGLYQAYRGDNPSEELRQSGTYYELNQ